VLTVVTSGKAAPGVTTATWALALTWPGPVLVADCDPAGGDMGPGLLAGRVSAEHGLLSWSTSARRGVPALTAASMLAQHVVELPERREVWFLPGLARPRR
jgi:2-keto-3-deoxy-galactonokinase